MKELQKAWGRIGAAIDALLSLLETHIDDDDKRNKRLALCLDDLVATYHATADLQVDIDEGPDAPDVKFKPLYQKWGMRFADFGYYPDVAPDADPLEKSSIGDAIDDLTDISSDLLEAKWYTDQERLVNAIWSFRFGYQFHWGQHLHDLRRYLYYKTLN